MYFFFLLVSSEILATPSELMIPPVSGSDSRSSLFEDLPDTEETVNDELTGEKMAVEPLDIDIQNAFEVMKNKNPGETRTRFFNHANHFESF